MTSILARASLVSATTPGDCEGRLGSGLRVTQSWHRKGPLDLPWAKMHPNKRLLFARVLKGGHDAADARPVRLAKYMLILDDETLGSVVAHSPTRVETRPDIYDYAPNTARELHVYVNFADEHLFGYWATGLFSQDELQVAEHPALADLRSSAA